MYKEKQQELIQKLDFIIKNTDYRDIKEKVGIDLQKRNVDVQTIILASEIITQNAKMEELIDDGDVKLLFFFADAVNKSLSDSNMKINLEDYFLKQEINEYQDYVEETKEESVFPIVIENANYINDHHWEGTITAKEMARLDAAKVPIYNPNTQRNPKITKRGEKINVDPQKVLAIRDDLLTGDYETDHIKWNILKNGADRYNYNAKKKTLTIYEGSIINIVDGMHRKEANSLAVAENPNLNYIWGLTIYNVSERKAHDIMVQINKQTPMSDEWLATKDYNLPENRVLSIMEDEKSNLFDIMKESDRHISNKQALVKKSNIATAIKDQYADLIQDSEGNSDNDGIRTVGRWLAEFFDYFIKLYSYEFKENPYEVKEQSFINWKNMFYGYIALSRELYKKDNWRELLKKKMSSIDFSKENKYWQDIGMLNTKDANLTLRKTLYYLFRKEVV